ncbi:hypothetical protein CEXT_87831 [Caerostris extrusa]|uniref:Uncharacterized protein n=1 Tax=Caerostris extrusa TaxID=172846 RepID=A0AAV4R079_CAEEX|nr:hypothetical protein CEXT_87831 [Caerostris extrusa]
MRSNVGEKGCPESLFNWWPRFAWVRHVVAFGGLPQHMPCLHAESKFYRFETKKKKTVKLQLGQRIIVDSNSQITEKERMIPRPEF